VKLAFPGLWNKGITAGEVLFVPLTLAATAFPSASTVAALSASGRKLATRVGFPSFVGMGSRSDHLDPMVPVKPQKARCRAATGMRAWLAGLSHIGPPAWGDTCGQNAKELYRNGSRSIRCGGADQRVLHRAIE
jgi:hypothetical protein